VPDEIKNAKFKKEKMCQYTWKKLVIMKRKDKKDICLMSVTHDEKLVQTMVRDQDIKKLRVVVDYYSMMRGEDMNDA
jgi:hypothetical protein